MTSDRAGAWFGALGVSFSYGEYLVLDDMDLAVGRGRIHALVGTHNSGKSTLCSILAGILQPHGGGVLVAGRIADPLSPKKARDLGVARVAAPPAVFSRLTVMENLVAARTGWWLGFSPRRTYEKAIRGWLDEHGLALPLDRRMQDLPREYWAAVDTLSRLFRRPRFLILDEMLDELGHDWRRPLLRIITGMAADGMSVLVATQKIEDALSVAHDLTVMRRGRAILTGPAGGMERLNLIRLCHDQLDDLDGDFSRRESFDELMRYTRAMLNDLPTAVIVLDAALSARFVNRRGRDLFPALAGQPGAPFGGIGNPRLVDFVQRTAAAGGAAELHAVPLLGGGAGALADIRVQPIAEHGARVGSMVIVEDVSIREDLRRRLMLSEKLASIGLLAAGVAHEVNNPLEIIGNYLNYLEEEDLAPGAKKALDKMEVEVGRIRQIVDNLTAYSGGRGGRPSRANPGELLHELAELLSYGTDLSRVRFDVDAEAGLFLAVDPNELRQILLNLVRNSLDAMPGGGVISVAVRPDAGAPSPTARIVVRDSGPGLSLDNPNDIFLPFVTTKKGEGAHQGLGLYVVYGIVEKYGGAITAGNRPEGGSEFVLTLPLAGPDSPAESGGGMQ